MEATEAPSTLQGGRSAPGTMQDPAMDNSPVTTYPSIDSAVRTRSTAERLPESLDAQRMPRHVALIMDGNARWARGRGLAIEEGIKAGAAAARRAVHLSCDWGVSALTLFAFSTENWKRSKEEVESIMQRMEKALDEEAAELYRKNVVVRVVGGLARLSPSLQMKIQEVRELTQSNTGMRLTIAFNYGGRQDIVQAAKELAQHVAAGATNLQDISEETFDASLSTGWLGSDLSSPDLLIRTSGEQRLSNFLLWQVAYSELVFCPVLWPDFDDKQYAKCLGAFQNRERRLGGRPGK